MADYIWVVSEDRNLNDGIPVTTNHYFHAESEDKAKAKYEKLCAKYLTLGYKCVYDDRFGTIEDIGEEEMRSSFRDFCMTSKAGRKNSCEVEIYPEQIK